MRNYNKMNKFYWIKCDNIFVIEPTSHYGLELRPNCDLTNDGDKVHYINLKLIFFLLIG